MMTIQDILQLAVQHHQAGRLAEAEGLYRQVLAQEPNHADVLHNLGKIVNQTGRPEVAAELIRRAIAANPAAAAFHFTLGTILLALGQVDDSITAFARATQLKVDDADALNYLGVALATKSRFDESAAAFNRAIQIEPGFAEAHNNLGNVLKGMGRLDQAITCYGEAIRLKPDFVDARNNLGNAWMDKAQLDQAIACYRKAIALKPDDAEAWDNLGNSLQQAGQLDEAIACHRRALELNPRFVTARHNLIFAMHYDPASDAVSLLNESRRWNQLHAPSASSGQAFENDRDPDRRVRIGYVSSDFWDHASMLFLAPLFQSHDRRRFEITCYSCGNRRDGMTDRCRTWVDRWREIVGLSDEQAAHQIRGDGIDILVDLKLHTDSNRLLVFARKPAPVQATWLGYPGTTGLDAIDYRLSDPYLDPPGSDETVYSEQTIRLPHCFWCYDPDPLGAEKGLAVAPLPATGNGFVTFGSLNNFCKVNDGVLDLWARLLAATDRSRLMLLMPWTSRRQHVREVLGDRVEFVDPQARSDYLRTYHRMDVALDTFPYNGHTTSLDSLWMGVPVVSLSGRTAVGRGGRSILSNIGLPDLIAHAPEEYIRLAGELANNIGRLTALRSSLRERMRRSPLMDASGFAAAVESAYRQMWRKWCALRR